MTKGLRPLAVVRMRVVSACITVEVCAYVGGQIGFVDHEEVAFGNAGAAFAGIFSPAATSIT
jgi:hypothetical protein